MSSIKEEVSVPQVEIMAMERKENSSNNKNENNNQKNNNNSNKNMNKNISNNSENKSNDNIDNDMTDNRIIAGENEMKQSELPNYATPLRVNSNSVSFIDDNNNNNNNTQRKKVQRFGDTLDLAPLPSESSTVQSHSTPPPIIGKREDQHERGVSNNSIASIHSYSSDNILGNGNSSLHNQQVTLARTNNNSNTYIQQLTHSNSNQNRRNKKYFESRSSLPPRSHSSGIQFGIVSSSFMPFGTGNPAKQRKSYVHLANQSVASVASVSSVGSVGSNGNNGNDGNENENGNELGNPSLAPTSDERENQDSDYLHMPSPAGVHRGYESPTRGALQPFRYSLPFVGTTSAWNTNLSKQTVNTKPPVNRSQSSQNVTTNIKDSKEQISSDSNGDPIEVLTHKSDKSEQSSSSVNDVTETNVANDANDANKSSGQTTASPKESDALLPIVAQNIPSGVTAVSSKDKDGYLQVSQQGSSEDSLHTKAQAIPDEEQYVD